MKKWWSASSGACVAAIPKTGIVLRLENVMSFVVSVLQRFLNWHVLRLAAAAARASKLLAARAPPEI
jgi:hypothetical protein